MKEKDLISEIGQIRSLMERSSKFMSISGLSGVLIGCYALIGAFAGYYVVYGFQSGFSYRDHYVTDSSVIVKLVCIASLVLLLALLTGFFMAKKKAQQAGQSIWNNSSKALFGAMAIPLLTGGIFLILALARGYYGIVGSAMLVFYGLALTAATPFTFKEVRWLGLMEIILGLFAMLLPGYGIWFWAMGFGILHIIYGLIVHNKYEK